MRRRLALVVLAVTLMLVIGLLVPLALSIQSQAELRALARAEADARAVATSLASLASSTGEEPTDEQIRFVLFTYAQPEIAILAPSTSYGQLVDGFEDAVERGWTGESFVARGEAGALAVIPVAFGNEPSLLVTAHVDSDALQEGVSAAWTILLGLGLVVTVAVVPVGNGLATALVRPVESLSRTARAWTAGDLDARIEPEGPPELVESAEAFNALVERLSQLLIDEREKLADVSHRLRTPITALRLQAESLSDRAGRASLLSDIDALERAITQMIEEVRNPAAEQGGCDLAVAVRDRMAFWGVAATAQQRRITTQIPTTPVPISVPRGEVVTILDTLVQNVLRHTPPGTAFRVVVDRATASLIVADEGTGYPPGDFIERGKSGGNSSGLGLDIARRIAEDGGGRLALWNDKGANAKATFSRAPSHQVEDRP